MSATFIDRPALEQALSHYKTRIEQVLTARLEQLPRHHLPLHQAMQHGLLQGGKRIRPFLVYATGSLVRHQLTDLDAPAAALECIHSYSLIHDDLPAMDNDDLRRGVPTVHIEFDEASAILAGDSLISLAFEILAGHHYHHTGPADVLTMIKLLGRHSGYDGMCSGQAIDLSHTDSTDDVGIDTLQTMHRLKTGALIKAAVMMASYCAAGFSPQDRIHLEQYASAIGLAFQVQDDILDVTGDTQTLGKPKGSDIQANKTTYVSLMGLEQARQKAQQLYRQALTALAHLPYDTSLLQDFASYVVQRNH